MTEFIGATLMAFALFCGLGLLGWHLWRRGKLTRLGFLPKPPN